MSASSGTVVTKGHPVLGAVSGFFLGFFLALDFLFFGVVRLDSVLITILPPAGLVVGLVLGLWAPLGRATPVAAAPTPAPAPAPAPAPPPTSAPPTATAPTPVVEEPGEPAE